MPVVRVIALAAGLPCALACADTVHGRKTLGANNGDATLDAQTPDVHSPDAQTPDDAHSPDAQTPRGRDAATSACAPRYPGAVKDDPRSVIPSGDCRRPTITGAVHHEDTTHCWIQFPAGADDTTIVAIFFPPDNIASLHPTPSCSDSYLDVGWRDEGCGKARLCGGANVCGFVGIGNTDGVILMPCGWTPDD